MNRLETDTESPMDPLDLESFLPHQGTDFVCWIDPEHTVSIRLVSATEVSRSAHQRQFALHFSGPGDHFIQQATYLVAHPELGETELFLVPIGKTGDGFEYEAFFNRLIESA